MNNKRLQEIEKATSFCTVQEQITMAKELLAVRALPDKWRTGIFVHLIKDGCQCGRCLCADELEELSRSE